MSKTPKEPIIINRKLYSVILWRMVNNQKFETILATRLMLSNAVTLASNCNISDPSLSILIMEESIESTQES